LDDKRIKLGVNVWSNAPSVAKKSKESPLSRGDSGSMMSNVMNAKIARHDSIFIKVMRLNLQYPRPKVNMDADCKGQKVISLLQR